MIAVPAAPAPMTTNLQSARFRPVNLAELIKPANTTTAVPCWSSWKTGISNSAFSRSSISKHFGAAISSRLMAPKLGAMALTVAIISSGS